MNKKISLLLTALILAAGISARFVRAEESKTIERDGYQQYFSAKTSVSNTSFTVTGVLLGWDARSNGGAASFFISASTNSPNSLTMSLGAGTSMYALNQSSTIFLANGDTVSDGLVRGTMINPIFYLATLDAATTFYIDISYLKKRDPQDPVGWGN